MINISEYIPNDISKTDKEFVEGRAEAIDILCRSRGLYDEDAWTKIQERFRADPEEETLRRDMLLISSPLAFSEAGYLYSINRFPGREYIDYLNRALYAVEVAIQTYDPERSSYKYYVEQCLCEVMEDLPQETIERRKVVKKNFDPEILMSRAEYEVLCKVRNMEFGNEFEEEQVFSGLTLKEALTSNELLSCNYVLPYVAGKDDQGRIKVCGLDDCKLLVIGGSYTSCFSIIDFHYSCITSVVMSILCNTDPSDVKMILLDSSLYAFWDSVYDGIDHLLFPVINDPWRLLGAVEWTLIDEVNRRIKKFEEAGVDSISKYNDTVEPERRIPHIVLAIAGYHNLMDDMKIDSAINSFLTKSREMNLGIHVVISTYRPSVDHGMIYHSAETLAAFATAYVFESRVLLGFEGLENLKDPLEMLFFDDQRNNRDSQDGDHLRAVMVDREDTRRVTDYLKASSSGDKQLSDLIAYIVYKKNCILEEKKFFNGPNGELDPKVVERVKKLKEKKDRYSTWWSILLYEFEVRSEVADKMKETLKEMGIIDDDD